MSMQALPSSIAAIRREPYVTLSYSTLNKTSPDEALSKATLEVAKFWSFFYHQQSSNPEFIACVNGHSPFPRREHENGEITDHQFQQLKDSINEALAEKMQSLSTFYICGGHSNLLANAVKGASIKGIRDDIEGRFPRYAVSYIGQEHEDRVVRVAFWLSEEKFNALQ